MAWNRLDEALAIARGFAEQDIDLQRQIGLFRKIEEIIQPDRMFVIEKALDLSENDDQASAYREAVDYNGAQPRFGNSRSRLYRQFIEDMNEWSLALDVTPDKLEQFIFG